MTAKLGQLLYTSCRKGLGNGAGLQTQAISPSVSPEQRDEAETLTGYQPPGLPVDTTVEQLQQLCPPEFRYTRFDSKRSALSRLVYAGADYSGRHGNFIAHSLLIPDTVHVPYPVDFVGYQDWIDAVADDPPNLKDIDTQAAAYGSLSLSQIAKFVATRADVAKQLPAMLHAVRIAREENRPVVIRDDPANAVLLVATLTKLFPRNASPVLEFSTFTNSLSSSCDIQCTTDRSEFDLSQGVREREAFVFDFVDGQFSTLPEPPDRYAVKIAAILQKPKIVSQFFEFVERSTDDVNRSDLTSLLDCFGCLYFESGKVSPAIVKTALRIAERNRDSREKIVNRLTARILKANADLPSGDRSRIAESLVATSGQLSDGLRPQIAECVEALLWMDLNTCGIHWAEIDASLKSIQAATPAAFTEKQISNLNQLLSTEIKNNRSPSIVLPFIHRSLSQTGVINLWTHETTLTVIKAAVDRTGAQKTIAAVLDQFPVSEAAACAEFCVALSGDRFTTESIGQVGKSLSKLLDRATPKQRSDIRDELSRQKAFHVLLAESGFRQRSAGQDTGRFLKYLQEVETNIGQEFSSEIAKVLQAVWEGLPQDGRNDFSAWLIQKPTRLERIDDDTRNEVVAHLDLQISLTPANQQDQQRADALEQAANTLSFRLPPLARVRKFMRSAAAFDSIVAADREWQQTDVELKPQHYAEVASAVVEPLISHSQSAIDHWRALEWCGMICDQNSVFDTYKTVVTSRRMLDLPPPAATAFALAAIGCEGDSAPGEAEAEFALNELNGWLRKLSERQFRHVTESVALPLESDPTRLMAWKKRTSEIGRARRTILRRISRLFGIHWS